MFSLTSLCLRKIDNDIIPLNIDVRLCCKTIGPCIVARYGHLECLKYARSHCRFNEDTCVTAAEYGYFECLTYAHKTGTQLNKRVFL